MVTERPEALPRVRFAEVAEPVASVVVIGFRRAPFLLGCLRALERSAREVPYELLLVLNQPDRELVDVVERQVTGARVLRTRVNVGFGGAVNLAATEARGEFLVLLNDDTEVADEWLERLVETARRHPEAGAVGSTMLFPDGSLQEAASVIWADGSTVTVGRGLPGDSRRYDYERKVDFGSGGALLTRKALFDETGGMDPAFFPAYYEDTDLCLRMAAAGHPTWYQPRARVLHHESMSTTSPFRSFLFARNRATFQSKWGELLAQRETAAPWDQTAIDRAVWKAMGSPLRVLLIDDQVADASIGSGYPRMADTLRSIQESGRYHLSLFASLVDGARDTTFACSLGVAVIDGFTPEDLRSHLGELPEPYAAVVISRPHNYERFAPAIRELHPATPIIYDAEALFHVRIERQAALGYGAHLYTEAEAMRRVETEIVRDADLVVTVSEDEAAFAREHTDRPVHVHSPLLHDIEPGRNGYAERADVVFVAGWAWGVHTPNVDALLWFARDVLPEVLARAPGSRLLVTGSHAPEPVLRLAGPSIVFTGRVPDLEAFYGNARVVIVPMRYGAGVKNKTVEALQFGVPTVSTSVGAEGIDLAVADCLLVDDDAKSFAVKVASLLAERGAWERQRALILAQHEAWRAAARPSVWPGVLDEVVASRREAPAAR